MAIQVWKVVREVKRLVAQCRNGFDLLVAPKVQKYRNRNIPNQIFQGALEVQKDAAVLLLFPRPQLLESTFEQLNFWQKSGVSPVAVVNGSVGSEERKRLLQHVHLLIERPNYGYDFGGYQAGVLEVLRRGYELDNLFIMNDSIWFPLNKKCDLIDKARTVPADLFGIFYNRRPKQPHRSHLQSYFYRFNHQVYKSPEFRAFWSDLIVYNNKDLTVRRNEMRLTHWFHSRGFSIDYLYDNHSLIQALEALSLSERYAIANYLIRTGDKFSQFIEKRFTSRAYDDDDIYLNDVRSGILGRYFLIAHPAVLIDRLNCPVLKKDRKKPYQIQRAVYLNSLAAQELSPAIFSEMKASVTLQDLTDDIGGLT